MPLNIPNRNSGSVNDISFGPARVFMTEFTGTTGVSPFASGSQFGGDEYDVGFIGEDGVNIELVSEKKDIVQGNPKLVNYSFVMSQSATISFTSIEYNFEAFRLALGAGTTQQGTADGATAETFAFGGEPLNTLVCMCVEHEMAVTSNTLQLLVWKAQSESGFSLPLGADEHSFEFSFKAIRATTDWGGTPLSFDEQLIRFRRFMNNNNF